jgi:hypothetical protein
MLLGRVLEVMSAIANCAFYDSGLSVDTDVKIDRREPLDHDKTTTAAQRAGEHVMQPK